MALEKAPFRRYDLKSHTDVITIKLNPKERAQLEEDKYLIQQEKDGTAIKQMWGIGAKVLRWDLMHEIGNIRLNNYRKNKRLGIVKFDQK